MRTEPRSTLQANQVVESNDLDYKRIGQFVRFRFLADPRTRATIGCTHQVEIAGIGREGECFAVEHRPFVKNERHSFGPFSWPRMQGPEHA